MSAEINFIKSKWLLSEFNEFRETDPAFLKIKENRKKWVENNRDKMSEAQCKYAKTNKEKINEYQNKRNKAISEIKSLTT